MDKQQVDTCKYYNPDMKCTLVCEGCTLFSDEILNDIGDVENEAER